jgi:hypothetical protein
MRGLLPVMLLLGTGAARADCPPDARITDWVLGNGLCQAVTTFDASRPEGSPALIVVVHGDISDGGAATYHVAFAKTLARLGTVVVALTRPGYTDDRGRTSQGRSYGRQDNYTRDTIAAVSGAIAALHLRRTFGRCGDRRRVDRQAASDRCGGARVMSVRHHALAARAPTTCVAAERVASALRGSRAAPNARDGHRRWPRRQHVSRPGGGLRRDACAPRRRCALRAGRQRGSWIVRPRPRGQAGGRRAAAVAHVPAKWAPVRRQEHARRQESAAISKWP